MEIRELVAFTKVVQLGSFTKAAEELHTSKARVSHLVSELEAQLKVRLLLRTTRSMSLTEVGQEIYERALVILQQLREAEKVAHASGEAPSGTLRITCGVEFGMLAVSEWMNRYMETYPEVRIEADFSGRRVDLVKEGFDIAIRIGQPEDSALGIRRLGLLAYGLYAAPDYLLEYGQPENPKALVDHRLLVFSGGRHGKVWHLQHKHHAEEIALKIEPLLRVNNSFAVASAAERKLGIALLPKMVAQQAVVEGRLATVLPDWQSGAVPVFALFEDWRHITPKVKAFLDIAVAHFSD